MTRHSISKTQNHYVDEGEGDVIILLYGLFGSVNNFRQLIQHLRQTRRVIVPVFPFFEMGTSINIFTLTEFLHDLTEEIGLKKFHLLGNSMGGHIALLYALKHPHKIESLILSGSSGLYENGMGDSFPKRKDYNYIKTKTELTFYDPGTASKELVDEIYETVNSLRVIQILSLAKSAIHNNLCKELSNIRANCCLIWGRNDIITPPAVALEFKRLIPHSTLSWIDQCGHVPMMEKPKAFNSLLDHFLESLREKTF
ncbi:MAG: alpha/beta hydrolase [Bacteroidota bacterium]|nr:alpha/beta hydrolase [Bacteroidota bacterium]